jgi:23S rRNA (uracil1939-C5)-methyltransferase
MISPSSVWSSRDVMKPGDTITVMAEGLSRHGDGVGTVEGVEVHAAGLLPGETGDVTLDYVSRQRPRAHGAVVHRRSTHPGRREPPCENHGRCNGCPAMDMALEHQRQLKQLELEEQYGLKVDRLVAPDGDGLGYRWSSKRVFAGERGEIVLGSYMRGTHNVADMSGCLVDHPDIVAACDELLEVCNALGAEPYDEIDEYGDLRYAWFKTDGQGQVLLTIVTAEPQCAVVGAIAERLRIPVGVAWGVNSRRGNDMRGTTVRPLRGRQLLCIDFGGAEVHVGPLGFLQPNPRAAALAYRDLVRVPAGGLVHGRVALDLYAGAGVTTSFLRRHFQQVLASESYPDSARGLGIAPELVEDFLARFLADPRGRHRSVDLVVANPPRGGMGPTVCDQLNRLEAPRLHVMSCGPASLTEDLRRLTGPDGAYRMMGARAFDTLPQTSHIEVVVWLVGRG